jgi:hypothetical protein
LHFFLAFYFNFPLRGRYKNEKFEEKTLITRNFRYFTPSAALVPYLNSIRGILVISWGAQETSGGAKSYEI